MSQIELVDIALVDRPMARTRPLQHEDWVDVARVVAIVLIVIVHVLNLDRSFLTLSVGSVGWDTAAAITVGTRWALPMFVMISGFLLLDPRKNTDWSTYYRRRMQRILWPLLAWTALYLGLNICNDLAAGRPVEPAKMAGLLIKGEPYYHLWYLYMLPGLYLICPFVKLATDQMNQAQLIGAIAICFGVTIFSGSVDGLYSVANVTYIDDFPRYLGYFLAGHLLCRVLPVPKFAPASAVLVAAFLVGAVAVYVTAQMFSPSRAMRLLGYGSPAIIAMSLAAFPLIRRTSVPASWRWWVARAGEASFGVYLVHPAILDVMRHWAHPSSIPLIATEMVFVLLSSLLVVLLMQRLPVFRRCV